MARKAPFILLLAALAFACQAPPASPSYHTGEFRVEGSGNFTHATIYFQAFGGDGVKVLYNVDLASPWTHSFSGVQADDDYFLAAQCNDDGAGTLMVEVLIDGTPEISDSTSVEYGYVAVYGTVP
jgi:hypothetical protein